MEFGAENYTRYQNFSSQRDRNDIQFLFALNSIRRWRNRTKYDIKVVHDDSKYFRDWSNLWKKFTSSKIPPGTIMYEGYPFLEFPLRVIDTCFRNSKDNFSLHLCDIIAGLAARCWSVNWDLIKKDKIDPIFYKEIFYAGLGDISMDAICPFHEFMGKDTKFKKLDQSNISLQLLKKINDYRILRLLEISTTSSKSM